MSAATHPADLTAVELLEHYRSHKLSPVEATQAALQRIAAHNPTLNAFCLVDEEYALEQARDSERRWMDGTPLGLVDGVPTSIKDILLTRGWPTLRGSRTISSKQAWDVDAPCTARLREHGAVLLGKTTTPEFGWKGVTDSPLTGVTRNPWNPALTPGGSSGGSSAALATGMGALSVGTDGGGSIRIPCGFTGVFGLKPSFGRVPAAPLSPFGTVSHVGPMTRCVGDAALMLTVISAPDWRDWYALPSQPGDYRDGLDDGVKDLRIAYSATLGFAQVDPEVARLVAEAVALFERLGARVESCDPGFDDPRDSFATLWYTGAANLLRDYSAEQRALLDPGLREIAEQGATRSALDYLEAVRVRETLGQTMNEFHTRYDLLLTPTLPIPAFPAGVELAAPDEQHRWMDWTPFSYPFNLTQQPAASVPCGLTARGLPVGLQVVGPRYADALVLRASRAFESVCPPLRPAPAAAS